MKKILHHLGADWYKYLLELIVITVGVLGAFILNSWNEQRKLSIQEDQIIEAIKNEAQANLTILKGCMQELDMDLIAAVRIRAHLGPELADISIDSLNLWFGALGSTQHCKIFTDVLMELKNSGRLSNIREEKIKRKIGQWSSSYADLLREENEWAQNFSNQFIPYSAKWISWDQIDYLFDPDGIEIKSQFPHDPRLILQQFEFANILNTHYWRMNRIKSRLIELEQKSNELIQLVDSNLKTDNN